MLCQQNINIAAKTIIYKNILHIDSFYKHAQNIIIVYDTKFTQKLYNIL